MLSDLQCIEHGCLFPTQTNQLTAQLKPDCIIGLLLCLLFLQAEEEAKRKAAELEALRSALDAGDKLESAGAEVVLRALLEEAGWSWASGESSAYRPAAQHSAIATNMLYCKGDGGLQQQLMRAGTSVFYTCKAFSEQLFLWII